jgi:hypothetical protein
MARGTPSAQQMKQPTTHPGFSPKRYAPPTHLADVRAPAVRPCHHLQPPADNLARTPDAAQIPLNKIPTILALKTCPDCAYINLSPSPILRSNFPSLPAARPPEFELKTSLCCRTPTKILVSLDCPDSSLLFTSSYFFLEHLPDMTIFLLAPQRNKSALTEILPSTISTLASNHRTTRAPQDPLLCHRARHSVLNLLVRHSWPRTTVPHRLCSRLEHACQAT